MNQPLALKLNQKFGITPIITDNSTILTELVIRLVSLHILLQICHLMK